MIGIVLFGLANEAFNFTKYKINNKQKKYVIKEPKFMANKTDSMLHGCSAQNKVNNEVKAILIIWELGLLGFKLL